MSKSLSEFSNTKQLTESQIRELQKHLKYLNNLADEINFRVEQLNELLREIYTENSTVEPKTEARPEPQKTATEISKAKLEGLPWQDFQNKSGSWIFASDCPTLANKLKKEPKKKLRLWEYSYYLSGDEDQFIKCYPRRKGG